MSFFREGSSLMLVKNDWKYCLLLQLPSSGCMCITSFYYRPTCLYSGRWQWFINACILESIVYDYSSPNRGVLGWWWRTTVKHTPWQQTGRWSLTRLPTVCHLKLPPGQSWGFSHCRWPSNVQWWVLRPRRVGVVMNEGLNSSYLCWVTKTKCIGDWWFLILALFVEASF